MGVSTSLKKDLDTFIDRVCSGTYDGLTESGRREVLEHGLIRFADARFGEGVMATIYNGRINATVEAGR